METFKLKSNPEVAHTISKYPEDIRLRIMEMRDLIMEVAHELDEITNLEETLKWGEPSYIAKHGSTLRMAWKSKNPNQFAMYFKCTSRLVETFKTVFKNKFEYEGNRAIVFQKNDEIPKKELKECIKVTLNYHKLKQLPTLGIS